MEHSILKVYDTPDEKTKQHAEYCGYVSFLQSMTPLRASYPAQYIRETILPALEHKKIKFYFNKNGKAVGYIIWAHIAADVEERFFRSGKMNLHLSEWNEGHSLWILDLVAPFGNLKHILKDLRDSVFKSEKKVRFYRTKNSKIMTKEISRDSVSHFFSSSSQSVK